MVMSWRGYAKIDTVGAWLFFDPVRCLGVMARMWPRGGATGQTHACVVSRAAFLANMVSSGVVLMFDGFFVCLFVFARLMRGTRCGSLSRMCTPSWCTSCGLLLYFLGVPGALNLTQDRRGKITRVLSSP